MSTAAQIAANIANAQSSTGPRTEEGKATTAKNSVTLGLYSGDFIRPNEHQEHDDLKAALHAELSPRGATEEILFTEILCAAWRLRRCAKVESHLANYLAAEAGEANILDAMEACGDIAEKIQKSVDRARAQSHRLFHKCRAELRRLQEDRKEVVTQAEKSPMTKQTQSQVHETTRNAPCPCGSNQKYKRCCGRSAPAMLKAA
jgi:uncharacterized protein YchJ